MPPSGAVLPEGLTVVGVGERAFFADNCQAGRLWDLHSGQFQQTYRPRLEIKLSMLSVLLGLGLAAPQVYGLAKPAAFAAAVRKFPRHVPTGIFLMILGTVWFLWNVNQEPIADFASIKPHMMVIFAAIGLGSCIFVQDFLAVRGLAVVLLLLGKLMVDTGRAHLGESPWVLLIQLWAYVLVVAGIWFTVSPWRLRDLLIWATATEQRIKVGSGIRLAFALLIVVLGLTAFRAM